MPRKVSRRSFLARVAGSAVVAGSAFSAVAARPGWSDTDPHDPPMRPPPRRRGQTGRTDSDAGPEADRSGYGRTGHSDSDPGDPAGYGRTHVSDSDPTDWPDYGRGTPLRDTDIGASSDAPSSPRPRRRPRTEVTDTDNGPGADPAGYGRTGLTDQDPADRPDYGQGPRTGPCPPGFSRIVDADAGPQNDHYPCRRARRR